MECPSLGRHQRGAETATGVPYDSTEEPKKNPVKQEALRKPRGFRKSAKIPGTLEIMGTTEPDGRSSRKPKGQDPERPSNLAFESTKDPNVPHRP